MASLRVQTVSQPSELDSLQGPWRTLEDEAENRLPFCTFEWTRAWWRNFPEQRSSVHDGLALKAVWRGDGKLAAVLPAMRTERPGRGPIRVRFLQPLGADPNITELRCGLFHPEMEAEAQRALSEDARSHGGVDWVHWSGVKKGSGRAAVLEAEPGITWTRDIPNFILPLAADWETFRSGLKNNIRESLRKCYNSLKRDNLAFELRIAQTVEDVPEALDHFFRLHGSRANVQDTVAHKNVFESPVARQFLIELTEAFARRGATRVFMVAIDGKVVALRIGYVLRDSIYMYYSGYDPDWGKYSVMTTVVAEAFKYAIAQGLKTANLSTGNDVSKTRWGPYEDLYREGVQRPFHARGKLAYEGYQWALKAKDNPKLKAFLGRYLGRRQPGP